MPEKTRPGQLYIAVFLASAALLITELSLTRIFAVTLGYHMTYTVISTALLGLGLGAFTVHSAASKMASFIYSYEATALSSLLLGPAIAFTAFFSFHAPSYSVPVAIFSAFIPFWLGGIFLSLVYTRYHTGTPGIYFLDLSGASTGAVSSILLMNALAPPGALLAASFIASAGALAASYRLRRRRHYFAIAIMLSALAYVLMDLQRRSNFLDVDYRKANSEEVLISKVLSRPAPFRAIKTFSAWDSYSRIDVVRFPGFDSRQDIYINGQTPAMMYRVDSNLEPLLFLKKSISFLPFLLVRPTDAFFIGSGAGFDILLGVLGHVRSMTACEINPLLVKYALDTSSYNGGLLKLEQVRTIVGEGRNILEREAQKRVNAKRYDLIMMLLAQTTEGESRNLALFEEFAYTVQAFRTYLDCLTQKGKIAVVVHSRILLDRLVATALTALTDSGMSGREAARSIMAFEAENRLDPYTHLLLVSRTPYDSSECALASKMAAALGHIPLFIPEYASGIFASPEYRNLEDKDRFISSTDARPATDDSPYFFLTGNSLPASLKKSLFVLFFIYSVSILFFLTGKLRSPVRIPAYQSRAILLTFFFAFTGYAFMSMELSLITTFSRFLAYPAFSLSTVLFSITFFGGLGGLFTGYTGANRQVSTGIFSCVAMFMASLSCLLLPGFLEKINFLEPEARALASLVILAPISFLCGMPFPSGLRYLASRIPSDIPWAWGLSSASSVLAGTVSLSVSILLGISYNFLISAILYLLAGYILYLASRGSTVNERQSIK